MRGLSVVIIAFNEAANIGRCIASVAGVADEVLVVDSGSVDDTVSIATGMGARVITQPFSGHIGQKNFAADNARHDWVLSLDADEALSDKLKEEIVAWKQQDNDTAVAYSMPRLTNYCGQWIKHCGWYPDVKTRLFNRKAGNWQGKNPHDRWAPADEAAVTEKLKGDILHYSYYTLSDHLRQIEKFTEIMARDAVAAGKTCSILKVTLAPKWRFVQDYLLRGGFLDGYYGFIICKYSAFATLVKYSKIRQYSRQKAGKAAAMKARCLSFAALLHYGFVVQWIV